MTASKEPEILINELRNPNLSNSLARELFQEAQSSGKILSTSFYTWLAVHKKALKVLTQFALEFPSNNETANLTILEHYSDYFKLQLDKSESKAETSNISIGRLFGLVERCKEQGIIAEYSVS